MIQTSNYNVKESIVDPNAPLRRRSGYHIFLRLETRRLKMIHGERSDSVNLREMAIDAWRSLSDKDKEVSRLCILCSMVQILFGGCKAKEVQLYSIDES